ncbi:Cell division cycle protein 16 like protein [Astathelohania contejeani]|uniref:Cell division cycle protein 16 like protein n=1 Tax=Astathelohania contejeani TaxID=164912 RepID=A0ABQ7HW12_9MICR|nr:Cell division cycle protein 16 like protein [Thelohania contejeani]
MYISILDTLQRNEMHWSVLVISEFLYMQDENIIYLNFILNSLFHLCMHERCIQIIQNKRELLDYKEIRMIYLKSIIKTKEEDKIYLYHQANQLKKIRHKVEYCYLLDEEAIEMFYEAQTKKGKERKDMLVNAFKKDEQNLEPLLYLSIEESIDTDELLNIIMNMSNKPLSELYHKILFPSFEGFNFYNPQIFSPFRGEKISRFLFQANRKEELFGLGVFLIKQYPNVPEGYLVLGINYLLVENYKEAKRCFYESVKIDPERGRAWLYLGISYSGLKECENAVSCFNSALKLMIGSFLPAYYLGYEYHKMNNQIHAESFYKLALEMKSDSELIKKYCTLLIFHENYEEALELLENTNFDLLKCYCNLFLGKIKAGEMLLKRCNHDWKYYATLGFIRHAKNNLNEAMSCYSQALILCNKNTVLEELMALVIENTSNEEDNIVYDYSSDLFDALDFKKSDILLI